MKLRLVLGALVALLVLGGCSDDPAEDAGPAPEEVTGPVTKVDSESLGEVTSFEVTQEGEVYVVLIDPEVNYGFALSHINEHLATGDPVRVGIDERDGQLYATEIADA
jgi:PBP1b-binding outer membrane lipoprotein LpoB